MRGLGWIRLGALALTLLVAAPSAEPQGIIANACNTAGGWCLLPSGTVVQITRPCRGYTTAGQPADRRTHAFNFSEVGRVNPSSCLNPHAPAPQRPTVTP